MPVPVDGDDPTVTKLRADIKILKGQIALVQAGDWDNSGGGRNTQWETKTIGSEPPNGDWYRTIEAGFSTKSIRCLWDQCLTILRPWARLPDSGKSYRVALIQCSKSALSKIVSHELSIKLDSDVSLDFTELRAGDISLPCPRFSKSGWRRHGN